MTSTLVIRKTPKPPKDGEIAFKLPIKGIIARKYFGHDGTLGGSMITVGPEDLPWWEGVLAAGPKTEERELRDLERVVQMLRDGHTVDMWFEV